MSDCSERLDRPYRCTLDLNLYQSPACDSLVTQAAAGRYVQILSEPVADPGNLSQQAVSVRLSEDDYPGWLAVADLPHLTAVAVPYQPAVLTAAEVQSRIPGAIAFAQAAMATPNTYLWGGTVAPNYDCSGLMQAAFAAMGVWLPRDAYQQEAFTQAIALDDLHPGDLVFFGTPIKATHVGLYLGEDTYIHSSGQDQGRNGIGCDRVSGQGHPVSQRYHAQWRGAGRIFRSYQPSAMPKM
jgi:cell wall-associated NlpC family hydrolase